MRSERPLKRVGFRSGMKESRDVGKAIPYGIYDVGHNLGWVNVGCDHDTGAFAVASIRRWWQRMGQRMYPQADEPWTGPSDWFKYRCRSCDHTDWVEDIVVDAFPPDEPGGLAAIVCPKCGGYFRYAPSKPVKRSLQHPDHFC